MNIWNVIFSGIDLVTKEEYNIRKTNISKELVEETYNTLIGNKVADFTNMETNQLHAYVEIGFIQDTNIRYTWTRWKNLT